jgi:uncharacterized protein YybS (DUF2232 family)
MSEGELIKPQRPNPGGGVRALAEGAMMTALALILAVISRYVPVLTIITQFLFPAPLAILVLRQGFKYGCIGAVSILLLSTILLGPPIAFVQFINYGFLGLFFGWCFRSHKKAVFTMLGGVLLSCASTILLLFFFADIMGISLEQIREIFTIYFHDYTLMLEQQGSVLPGSITVEGMVEAFMGLLPALLFLGAMFGSFACYIVMGHLLRRLSYDIPKLPPFRDWRLDWRLLWVLIIAMVASSLGERLQYNLLSQIANNLLSAMLVIFAVYGLTIFIWIFWRYKVATFIRVLAILFLVQLFSGGLLIIAGVFDPLFDLRGRLERYAQKRTKF